MCIGVSLLYLLYRAVTEDDASYDRFILMFRVFGWFVKVKVLAELLFVIGERVVG